MVAKFFAPNLSLAHILPLGATGGIKPVRKLREHVEEPFPVLCARCKTTFHTTNVRKKFCNDDCKNAFNVAKHRRRRTPAETANAKHEKNRKWSEWRVTEATNFTGFRTPPPPKIVGRPKQEEKNDHEEWKRLDAIRKQRGLPSL